MSGSAIKDDSIQELLRFGPLVLDEPLSKKEFYTLAARYPGLRMERAPNGKTTIMSPVKFGSGNRESLATIFLGIWWLRTKLGETFSASTGIELPNGAIKSPDCGWISPERLARVSAREKENEFLKVMPDFIVEVRSKTDRLPKLRKKMENTWMKHGVRLAWLIDPFEENAYIYRENGEMEVVEGFEDKILSGEAVMPGMELPLGEFRVGK